MQEYIRIDKWHQLVIQLNEQEEYKNWWMEERKITNGPWTIKGKISLTRLEYFLSRELVFRYLKERKYLSTKKET